ncbi:MAG: PilN domain-containing protein [Tepidisphaeraceae bacterium]
MRELEFLPSWYPQARRRKRMLCVQAWTTLTLVMGLALWCVLIGRNLRIAQASLGTVDAQLKQTHSELIQLDEQLTLKKQLELQRQIVAKLGLPVQFSRLLRTIDAVMPREMSLVEVTFDTDEQVKTVKSVQQVGAKDQPLQRRLRVKLLAVAPSDVDLANFLSALANHSFFEQVAMTFARDRTEAGHVMREFEVTFSMNLDQAAFD